MRAIVNGKLYDTERATHTLSLCFDNVQIDIYVTQKQNIFAVNTLEDTILDSEQVRKSLERNPKYTDAYIEIFGMPEEA